MISVPGNPSTFAPGAFAPSPPTTSASLTSTPSTAEPPPGLSAEHIRILRAAERAAAKITRARRVASFSGWTTGIFGALTLVTAIGDWPAFALGLGLSVSAFVELRGGKRIAAFDPQGARILGFNQIALGVMLLAFALWRLLQVSTGPSMAAELNTGDPAIDEMVTSLEKQVRMLVYGTIAIVAVLAPGLTALYYFTRGPVVRKFVASTPPWVLELLRAVR